ncbi:hypothetical protein K443DRAFT_14665 [Laccaria amethystina LaAM-08-1]|uniref:Uncharacterized protein n=1 Tax=Laccaria amethystina LaAM-08-1 TaxID=1095629 RepID=A0A0C9WSQ4_9AGAR|nr:hypothetical protein K443DRAFT_14665 [Laccaria amethystina LaAM-08-1]
MREDPRSRISTRNIVFPKSPHYHPPILYAFTNEHWTSQATASSLPSSVLRFGLVQFLDPHPVQPQPQLIL